MSNSFEELMTGLKSIIGMIKKDYPEHMSTMVLDVFNPEIKELADMRPDMVEDIIDLVCLDFIERESVSNTKNLTDTIQKLNDILAESYSVVEREAEIRQRISTLMLKATSGKYGGRELSNIYQGISQLVMQVDSPEVQSEYQDWMNARMQETGICEHEYTTTGVEPCTTGDAKWVITKKCVWCGDTMEFMTDVNPFESSDEYLALAQQSIDEATE